MVGRISVVLVAVGPLGCFIPSGIDIDDFTGTDLSLTATLTDTLTTTLPVDTVASVTATDSVTSTSVGHDPDSSTSGDDSSTGDTDGPSSVCEPQPEHVDSRLVVDDGEVPDGTDLLTPCAVISIGIEDDALHIGLACADGEHTVDVADIGPVDLEPGDEVELALYVDMPWWSNVYVALRKDGELVLAAMEAETLPEGDGHSPSENFWEPLRPVVLEEVCDPEPPGDAPCHSIICPQTCTRDRRLALAFFADGDAEVVYDAGSGQLGELQLVVGKAREHIEVFCTDTPSGFFSFLALREP